MTGRMYSVDVGLGYCWCFKDNDKNNNKKFNANVYAANLRSFQFKTLYLTFCACAYLKKRKRNVIKR